MVNKFRIEKLTKYINMYSSTTLQLKTYAWRNESWKKGCSTFFSALIPEMRGTTWRLTSGPLFMWYKPDYHPFCDTGINRQLCARLFYVPVNPNSTFHRMPNCVPVSGSTVAKKINVFLILRIFPQKQQNTEKVLNSYNKQKYQ